MQENTTSNAKIAKKVRQMYRREVKAQALESISKLQEALRPRPRYVPKWLWYKLVALVIKIDIA